MPLVETASVRNDPGLYPRLDVDQEHVERLAEAIRAGAKLPPIVVTKGTTRFLIDGYHRLAAWRKVHGDSVAIQATVKDLPDKASRLLESIKLNAAHGRPLSQGDRIRCIEVATRLKVSGEAVASALNMRAVGMAELQSFAEQQSRAAVYDQQVRDASSRRGRDQIFEDDEYQHHERIDVGPKPQGIGMLEAPSETAFYVNRLIIAFTNNTIPPDPNTCRQLRALAEHILRHLKAHEAVA